MKNENSLVQDFKILNNLPKNWEVLDFDKVIIDVSGGNKKTKNSDLLNEGSVKVVDQGKELIAGFTNEKETVVKTEIPHIVFGDHTRVLKYIDFPFAMGADGTKVLKIKKGVKSFEKFIYYFFQTLTIPETGYNRHFKYLKDCKIPLPNLETQKRIAAILDEADSLRQLNKQLIAKYDALTQSLFLDMFGDPVMNPKGWEKVKFNKICSFDKISIKPEKIISGTFYIGLESIEKETGKILGKVPVVENELKSNKFYFDKEYILYGKLRPYLNKVGNPDFEGICSTDIIPLKPLVNKSNKQFVTSIMRSSGFVSWANERCSGANLPRISPKEVEKYLIINPPIHLQNQFAERVQLIEQQKQQAQDALQKSEALFNSLLQQAFKGALV